MSTILSRLNQSYFTCLISSSWSPVNCQVCLQIGSEESQQAHWSLADKSGDPRDLWSKGWAVNPGPLDRNLGKDAIPMSHYTPLVCWLPLKYLCTIKLIWHHVESYLAHFSQIFKLNPLQKITFLGFIFAFQVFFFPHLHSWCRFGTQMMKKF